MGSKSGKPQVPVTDYTMSVHAGICCGPIDALLAIYTGEKKAWEGEVTTEDDIIIDNRQLYGGPEKEGGVQGIARFLPGGPAQVLPDSIAARFGLTGATMPGFRGVSSIFFHGDIGAEELKAEGRLAAYAAIAKVAGFNFGKAASMIKALNLHPAPNGVKGKPGFYWQSNNPNIKTIWAKVRRRAVGLTDSLALIADSSVEGSNSDTVVNLDANPAHIIYEALTNTDWGMGAASTQINVSSFEAAALTLYNEQFGLSMLWTQSSTVEDFVSEVLDHIQATIYVNPRDGLITIKLLRADYDVATIPEFTPDNCVIAKLARKGEGELINEISVTWTNPANEEDETVTVQNLAGITASGAVISDGRNYYGIRNVNLAMQVGTRDLRAASAPLAKTEMLTSRKGWALVPGEVFKATYPEHGLDGTVFRVGNIKYGKPGDVNITVTISEDVFGLNPGSYVVPNSTAWRDPSRNPNVITETNIFTLPWFVTNQVATLTSPEVYLGVLGASTNPDAFAFDLLVESTLPDGSLEFTLSGQKDISGHALLDADLDAEATTIFEAPDSAYENAFPTLGGYVIFGVGEATCEWAFVDSVVEDSNSFATDAYVLKRGILDTTPKAWPAGTAIWYIDVTTVQYDDTTHSVGETVNFKMLTRTSLGTLDEDTASIVSYTATDRPYLPLRPANVKVEGVAFNTPETALDLSASSNSATDTMAVTWARRNRETEDTVILAWDDLDTSPPAGVTTTVAVLSQDGLTVWTTNDGIAGTSYDLAFSDFSGPTGRVKVTAKDGDGNESLQGHEISVRVRQGGYGLDYGLNYGGV